MKEFSVYAGSEYHPLMVRKQLWWTGSQEEIAFFPWSQEPRAIVEGFFGWAAEELGWTLH